jgi:hypothetical protein
MYACILAGALKQCSLHSAIEHHNQSFLQNCAQIMHGLGVCRAIVHTRSVKYCTTDSKSVHNLRTVLEGRLVVVLGWRSHAGKASLCVTAAALLYAAC